MWIWCMKICIVWIFHLIPGSRPLLVDCKSPRIGICLKVRIWIKRQEKKWDCINSSQIEGSPPSYTALSFYGFGSISRHSVVCFPDLYSHNISDFPIFRPEYYWRDIIFRNPHLVHQNWYRINFTLCTTSCHSLFRCT
jgi:hypothetical protein